MEYIIFLIGIIIGYISFAYFALQVILTGTVSEKLTKKNEIEGNQARYDIIWQKMYLAITVNTYLFYVIFEVICACKSIFVVPQLTEGFFIGCLLAFLVSLPRLGKNQDNTSDYMKTYGKYYSLAVGDNYDNSLMYRFRFVIAIIPFLIYGIISAFAKSVTGFGLSALVSFILNIPTLYLLYYWKRMFRTSVACKNVSSPAEQNIKDVKNACYHTHNNVASNNVQQPKDSNHDNVVRWLLSLTMIFGILSLMLIMSVIALNNTITEQTLQIEEYKKQAKSFEIQLEMAENKLNAAEENAVKEYKKYTDYIFDYEEALSFNTFMSRNQVIVVKQGDIDTGTLICEYDVNTVYADTDNDNIQLKFDDKWGKDSITYYVTGVSKGCSTITFTNDKNQLKDTVLVIVK